MIPYKIGNPNQVDYRTTANKRYNQLLGCAMLTGSTISALKEHFAAWFESPDAMRRKAISDSVYYDFTSSE